MPLSVEVAVERGSARALRQAGKAGFPGDPERVYSMTTAIPAAEEAPMPPSGRSPVVRRPNMGLVPRRASWVSLEVVATQGNTILPLINTSYRGGAGPETSNFLIQEVRLSTREATQVRKTFGDFYISDIGEEPRVLQVRGVLFEAANFPWMQEWMANYERYVRARRCILNRTQVHMTCDGSVWRGYVLNGELGRAVSQGAVATVVPFSFEMVLRSVEHFGEDGVRWEGQAPDDPPPAIRFYQEQFERDETVPSPGLMARIVYSTEIEAGSPEDALPRTDPVLDAPASDEDLLYTLNIGRLTAIAADLNAFYGRDVYDLGEVRRDLETLQNQAMSYRGSNSPYGDYADRNLFGAAAQAYGDRIQGQIKEGVDQAMDPARRRARGWSNNVREGVGQAVSELKWW